jgi:hypothetical protein
MTKAVNLAAVGSNANSGGSLITSGTMQTSPPATPQYFDFTSIPPWVKRITIMFDSISTNGTSNYLIQLGDSGGIETSGYVSSSAYINTSADMVVSTAGFILNAISAPSSYSGAVVLTLMDSATNKWTVFGGIGWYPSFPILLTTGAKSLSATLDRIRITTVIGTNTFDAGSVNILYE